MRKPRMTASEKAFVAEISALVFANPEIRDGNRFLDRQTFATLPKFAQQRYIYLLATKTR
jgi:hypothetical protein